jgi:ribokinase
VDILTPNESEALLLLGRPAARVTLADAPGLASGLLDMGPRAVVLKLGDQGCFYTDGRERIHMPAFAVEARDATAAGDTFNGALAVALAEGQGIAAALRFACAAAALSVSRLGAQSSIPTRAETETFLLAGATRQG